MAKGYCDICKVSSTNMTTHRKTAGHKKKVEEYEKNKSTKSGNEGSAPVSDELQGESKTECVDVREVQTEETVPENNKTIAGIQIIDSSTNKKSKHWLEEALDVAFSEKYAPITLSIIDAIGKRINGVQNQEQEEGQLVQTVSGGFIRVPNKEF